MNEYLEENRPETCNALGLDCRTCIRDSAAQVARLCGSMQGKSVRQTFFNMYPSTGCTPMMAAFELAYAHATGMTMERVTGAAAA